MPPARRKAQHSDATIAKYSRTPKPPYQCKECDYTTSKMGSLTMHTNRKHNRSIKAPVGRRQPRQPGAKWGLAPADNNGSAPSAEPVRKQYRRRQPEPEHWAHCPRCGFNLALAAEAYAVAQSVKS